MANNASTISFINQLSRLFKLYIMSGYPASLSILAFTARQADWLLFMYWEHLQADLNLQSRSASLSLYCREYCVCIYSSRERDCLELEADSVVCVFIYLAS